MARKSQHSFLKRQREQKKAEKAAQKLLRKSESQSGSDPLDAVPTDDETPDANADDIAKE